MTLPNMSETKAFLAASSATIPQIKAEVIANAGHYTWQQKIRKAFIGGLTVAAGGYLVYAGVKLLIAGSDVGKWLVAGGVVLGVIGATIWDSELVGGALKSVPGWIADGIALVWGATTRAKAGTP